MLIKQLMKKAMAIEEDVSLEKASKLMSKKDIDSLIIIKRTKIIGIITQEDLVENFSKRKKVSSVMSKPVITIKETEKTSKAIDVMKQNQISVLPVVDKKGNLVGVINSNDLLEDSLSDDEFLMN